MGMGHVVNEIVETVYRDQKEESPGLSKKACRFIRDHYVIRNIYLIFTPNIYIECAYSRW